MLEKVSLPQMQKGLWRVERFRVDRTDFSSLFQGRDVPVGEEYTRLMRGGTLVMSDTPAEMRDHRMAVRMARGRCLLNGLGIGMVLKAILKKPEVTEVTVIEVSQDLIDLVAPHYSDPRITFVCCDAYAYQPPKGKRFQMVWHDIWDDMCSDNLEGMAKLHRKYGRRADWQGSWGKQQCLEQRQRWG